MLFFGTYKAKHMSAEVEPKERMESSFAPLQPGKDEMNFAEFPIAMLTDRVPKGQRSIKFEDEVYSERKKKLLPRKRLIEGSEEYGLPTATDDTVILALIQLTKLKSNFTKREVDFTRRELIHMLGWANEGKSYDRLKTSLLRIKGVNYFYDNAWWDTRLRDWTTRAFAIIDNVEINDSRASDGQGGLFPSRIVWNEIVFDSLKAGFVRDIDFQLCIRLEHATALRMYRFLGKRFYVRPDWTFDLKEFASVYLNLGRNYEGGTQISRKLKPAIAELEKVGFLEPLTEKERFPKKGRDWSIRLVKKSTPPALVIADDAETDGQSDTLQADAGPMAELIKRGVTAKSAGELAEKFPVDYIMGKIEQFDWQMTQPKPPKSPPGFLVRSIRDDYNPDPAFVSPAELQRSQAAQQAKEREAAEERRRKQQEAAQEQQDRDNVNDHLRQLSASERSKLEAAALTHASPEAKASYDNPLMVKYRETLMLGMLREYLAPQLRNSNRQPADA